jgi:hypothetical protein
MSALRKLRQAKLKQEETQQSAQSSSASAAAAAAATEQEDDDSNSRVEVPNPFDFLKASQEEEEEEEEQQQQQQQQQLESEAAALEEETLGKSTSTGANVSYTGKKKKKAKNSAAGGARAANSISNNPNADEDIDSLLSEFKISANNNYSRPNPSQSLAHTSLFASGLSSLRCEAKFFDAELEIRAKFGRSASVKEKSNDKDEKTGLRVKKGRLQQQGRKPNLSASLPGRIKFVKPNSDWPQFQSRGDIKLIHIQPNQLYNAHNNNSFSHSQSEHEFESSSHIPYLLAGLGCRLFQFQPTQQYKQTRSEFISIIHSHDIQQCYYFSRSAPYFPDSCLQISEIQAAQQDFVQSHLSIQRLLYYYQQNWSGEFDLKGQCRMDPNVDINKQLLSGLALHAQMLGKKSCPRTALEICKFVLSLSPLLDTQCIALFIDYYILRAKQYEYLFQLVNELDAHILTHFSQDHPWTKANLTNPNTAVRPPLFLLPNIMFGLALSRFHLDNHGAEIEEMKTPLYQGEIALPQLPFKFSYGSSTARSNHNHNNSDANLNTLSASHLLQQAILLYPEAVGQLLIKSGNEKEAGKSEWSSLISKLNYLYPSTNAIDKLLLVFTERASALYKNAAIINWIRRESEQVINRINSKSAENSSLQAQFQHLRHELLSHNLPPCIRLLQKYQYTDSVPSLPPELLMAQTEERLAGHAQGEMSMEEMQVYLNQMTAAGQQPLDLTAGPLRLFLQSLLPWNIIGPQALANPADLLNDANNVVNAGGQNDLIEPVEEGGFNFQDYQFSSEEEGSEHEVHFPDQHQH